MPTVTVYTAARMKTIEDKAIVAAQIIANELILTQFDGTPVNAGSIDGMVGPQGPPGTDGTNGTNGVSPDFGGYVEPLDDRGNVSGAVSLDFATHNVWRINPTGAVTISFANLPAAGNIAPGTIIVANSNFAITWPVGTKFHAATAPELDGETWLALVAQSTHVTVGASWSGVA